MDSFCQEEYGSVKTTRNQSFVVCVFLGGQQCFLKKKFRGQQCFCQKKFAGKHNFIIFAMIFQRKLVDKTKRGIIQLYLEDFQKIDTTGNAERLFKNIPSQLSGNVSRYQPYTVVGQQSEAKMGELLQDLEQSKTTLFCYHCTDPNVGMSLNKDTGKYKMYLADTGLFVTLCFWDKSYTENVIYDKLLSDKLEANLGYLYENLVAQMLATAGNELFYYTFPKDDKHNYEIDFLLSRGNKLVPIEVKSSGYKTHKSLDVFCEKYSSRVGNRILLYTKDYQKNGATIYLPIYMTPLI